MTSDLVFWAGAVVVLVGGVFDFIAGLGMLRFPNFYVRLHAATIGAIYGAVLPLIGVALMALGTPIPNNAFIAGGCLATALVLFLVAPIGSHLLAYAAHKARAVEWSPVVDQLGEEE
ncbi:Na+/H+ antiporter, subunit MnhG [Thermogladius calderae 1633]|uniref:Na+/H+ antiporter, subunit MnhG n=1 Tax=Thermogladius calderae (strain DSM 22663 / VKM B-2946 / 1633) TaxID=1184251 RepID=I3TF70_THEC1|nr:monovalent cation/H(+) antiporter subunit G [Thermogladius calderae]AFK51408.1 Na+/H+ antiporter, subunit MnhG [Thermogladius calderae 1633]